MSGRSHQEIFKFDIMCQVLSQSHQTQTTNIRLLETIPWVIYAIAFPITIPIDQDICFIVQVQHTIHTRVTSILEWINDWISVIGEIAFIALVIKVLTSMHWSLSPSLEIYLNIMIRTGFAFQETSLPPERHSHLHSHRHQHQQRWYFISLLPTHLLLWKWVVSWCMSVGLLLYYHFCPRRKSNS